MSAWPEPASYRDAPPKTLRYCKVCKTETQHEVRSGSGVIAIICVPCLTRVLCELDKD